MTDSLKNFLGLEQKLSQGEESQAPKSKKQLKKEAILNSAFELFADKGINNTSIDDIVKKAGIAKGTFYLYFEDKYAVADRLVFALSSRVLHRITGSLDEFCQNNKDVSFEDRVIYFVDQLLSCLMENKEIAPIVHKNISKGLFMNDNGDDAINKMVARFTSDFVNLGGTKEQSEKRFYMIVELANSVIYNAVMDEEPYSLEEIKIELYEIIRRMIKP